MSKQFQQGDPVRVKKGYPDGGRVGWVTALIMNDTEGNLAVAGVAFEGTAKANWTAINIACLEPFLVRCSFIQRMVRFPRRPAPTRARR